jgi:NAD(P)-dependent dehydrogenase (short-subunit alcohol dehydrogenase family)
VDLELTDKVAVVTGASKGIGLAVVHELAAEGAKVIAGARTIDSLQGIEAVAPLAVDLADPDGPGRLIEHAIELHGRIDVLVNNVGAAHVRVDGFLATGDEDFESSLRTSRAPSARARARTGRLPGPRRSSAGCAG